MFDRGFVIQHILIQEVKVKIRVTFEDPPLGVIHALNEGQLDKK